MLFRDKRGISRDRDSVTRIFFTRRSKDLSPVNSFVTICRFYSWPSNRIGAVWQHSQISGSKLGKFFKIMEESMEWFPTQRPCYFLSSLHYYLEEGCSNRFENRRHRQYHNSELSNVFRLAHWPEPDIIKNGRWKYFHLFTASFMSANCHLFQLAYCWCGYCKRYNYLD